MSDGGEREDDGVRMAQEAVSLAPAPCPVGITHRGPVILSGAMMLRHLGWKEAAALVIEGMDGAIGAERVTYDFARQMEGATKVQCAEFGDAVIAHM